jgi:flagellar FliJ protein
MLKYTFRLEPVLKIRKLKEETCRMELGRLIGELSKIEDQLRLDRKEIDNYYSIQEGALKSGMNGGQLQAFPLLISAKNENIKRLEKARIRQEQLIAEKKQELAKLKGDLKVMENLKQKDYDEYRKAVNKQIDQKVEEQTQNWLRFKENL